MPLNLTASSVSGLISAIRQVNSQPNTPDQHIITLTSTFPATATVSAAASGVGGDADLFGLNAFPVILRNLRIVGNNKTIQRSTVAGTPQFRIFAINAKQAGGASSNAKLTIENLGIKNGNSGSSGGGGIINDAPLILKGCRLSNNTGGTLGGAIYGGGGYPLEVYDSTFTDNVASGIGGQGGAIFSTGTALIVKNSSFVANIAAGTAGKGGAIYNASTPGAQVSDCSFRANVAASGARALYNASSFNLEARYCWWGAPTDPDSTTIGGQCTFQPCRTTLPRFVSSTLTPTNPVLPPVATGCKIIAAQQVNVRRGPSIDDLTVATLSQGTQVDARVRAIDEDGQTWYGFEHSSRPNYISWVIKTDLSTNPATNYTNLSSGCSESALPLFNTQPDSVWTNTLQGAVTVQPLATFAGVAPFSPFRGFGEGDGANYATIPQCAHPGLDFFPANAGQNPPNVQAFAAASGIVVGMGVHNTNPQLRQPPANWGASLGGFNLVIRIGGHFVLYGHLASIDPSLQVGTRVQAADLLGILAVQTSNTHLHLEVRAFTSGDYAPDVNGRRPLRPRFGAVNRLTVGRTPTLVLDPVLFLPAANRGTAGTPTSISFQCPTGGSTITYNREVYTAAMIGSLQFSYKVRQSHWLQCLNLVTGGLSSGGTCVSPVPPP